MKPAGDEAIGAIESASDKPRTSHDDHGQLPIIKDDYGRQRVVWMTQPFNDSIKAVEGGRGGRGERGRKGDDKERQRVVSATE